MGSDNEIISYVRSHLNIPIIIGDRRKIERQISNRIHKYCVVGYTFFHCDPIALYKMYYTFLNKPMVEKRKYDTKMIDALKNVLIIYEMVFSIGLDKTWIYNAFSKHYNIRKEIERNNEIKPLGQRRDNRKEKVLNGGDDRYGHTNARYPSKKRSKQQWKNFYNNFPNLAKKDSWDGEKSDRM